MTFFQNENIHSVVVDRVTCNFAKPTSEGKPGTHYTVVMFDKKKNVLYVGCECEHMHGESIAALHEMSGSDGTCFKVTQAFKDALNFTKNHKNKPIDRYGRQQPKLSGVSPFLSNALETAFVNILDVHNKRVQPAVESSFPLTGVYGDLLQNTIDRLTTNFLNLPTIQEKGKHEGRLQDGPQHKYVTRPRLFTLRDRKRDYVQTCYMYDERGNALERGPLGEDDKNPPFVIEPGVPHLVLTPTENAQTVLAVKVKGRPWHICNEVIAQTSEHLYSGFTSDCHWAKIIDSQRHVPRNETYCVYCNRSFKRMSKHVKSEPHRRAVRDTVCFVTRATSSMGLRLVNDRRNRETFRGRRT